MTMQTSAPMNARRSFCEKLLAMFQANQGEWIESPLVAEVGGLSYTKRIHELRRRGWKIENKTERMPNGMVHGWYRLVTASPLAVSRSDGPDGTGADR